MTVAHEERHELELAMHASRHDSRAVHAWLVNRRKELDAKWPGLEGNDLLKAQGEAKSVAKLIELIEQGPKIQPKKPERAT